MAEYHASNANDAIIKAMASVCKPCCGVFVPCDLLSCLAGWTDGRIFTTVTGCDLGTPFWGASGSDMSAPGSGCDQICVDDPEGTWKFDSHDVSIEGGCLLGEGGPDINSAEDWSGTCTAFLWCGLCCITRDNGFNYMGFYGYLFTVTPGPGFSYSIYSYKTRKISVTTDGTYTYFTVTSLSPWQTALISPRCCAGTPILSVTFRLTVDGTPCL